MELHDEKACAMDGILVKELSPSVILSRARLHQPFQLCRHCVNQQNSHTCICTLLRFAGSCSHNFADDINMAITQLADLTQKPNCMVINVMSAHPGSLTTDSSELDWMFVIWMSSVLY